MRRARKLIAVTVLAVLLATSDRIHAFDLKTPIWPSEAPSKKSSVPGCHADELAVPQVSSESMSAVAATPELRVLYFVPADLPANPAQEARIVQTSHDVDRWYWDHTENRKTIVWGQTVERVIGLQTLAFYSVDFWARVLTELTQRGYSIWGPQKVFVIWVKGAGQYAGGAQGSQWSGIAMLGGEIFIQDGCVPTHPSNWPCTPGGAMAHELGHALGMPHPDTAGGWGGVNLNDNSLMGAHWNFPERDSRSYTPTSPWGLLNYERDHLLYNPLVSATTSPYPPLAGDPTQKPALPSPALAQSANPIGSAQTQLNWNADGAFNFYAYWSESPDFQTYSSVGGSPTPGTTLTHTDGGQPRIYFKVFEIPLSN
jgi:hypothetical protein